MLRPFYLSLLAVVMLAPCGCAGAAWWLSGEPEDAGRDDGVAQPRAGAAAMKGDSAVGETIRGGANNAPASVKVDGGVAAAAPETSGKDAGQNEPARQAIDGHSGKIAATKSASDSAAVDPLVEEVRALGLDNSAEEASAIAALRAAPEEHRKFLLRTMYASAAARRQQEARLKIMDANSALAASKGAPKTDFDPLSNGVTEQKAGAGNPATTLPLSRTASRSRDAVENREIGPTAPNVVQPASYLDGGPTVRAARTLDTHAPMPVRDISHAPHTPASDWQSHLQAAVAALEAELANSAGGADRTMHEARLRLLYLVANRRDEALRSRAGTSLAEQEFWSKQMYGLSTLLDSAKQPDLRQRAAIATPHLRQAAERLGELGGLTIKNLHFCTEVKGYGAFVKFPQDEFRLGQEVLLYCEVESFQSNLTEKGYHTALKARYEVFDASGSRVAEKDLGLKDEHCQNRRRDFFVPYFLWMPKQVPPGKYQLKLTLEDVHAGQTAEATIEFGIREK